MAIYDYSSGGFPASPVTDDTLAMKGTTYKYNGSAWEVQAGGTTSFTYTATSGQTAFTGADTGSKTLAYTAASIHVFLNGILLDAADYTATDGTTVTLAVGATTGDTMQVVAYGVLVSAGGGGGGAWEVINSTTANDSASVVFSLSGYSQYMVTLFDVVAGTGTATGAPWFVMEASNAGVTMSEFAYQWERIGATAYTLDGNSTGNQPLIARTWFDSSILPKLGLIGEMLVIATAKGTQVKSDMASYNNGSVTRTIASVRYYAATQADQITLKLSTGTVSGTFTLYGIKTS